MKGTSAIFRGTFWRTFGVLCVRRLGFHQKEHDDETGSTFLSEIGVELDPGVGGLAAPRVPGSRRGAWQRPRGRDRLGSLYPSRSPRLFRWRRLVLRRLLPL